MMGFPIFISVLLLFSRRSDAVAVKKTLTHCIKKILMKNESLAKLSLLVLLAIATCCKIIAKTVKVVKSI